MITALIVYLTFGVLAALFTLIRTFSLGFDSLDRLSWSHVLTMIVGLVATWPFVLFQEAHEWWRGR